MKKLLVAVDDCEVSWKAVDFGSDLALKQEADLYLLHVIREKSRLSEALWEQIEATYRTIATGILTAAAQRAAQKGVKNVLIEIGTGDAAGTIVKFAEQQQVDAILIGGHRHNRITGLLLGSVSYKVLSLAPCTVIVVR